MRTLFDRHLPTARSLVEGDPCNRDGWGFETEECGPVFLKRAVEPFVTARNASLAMQKLLGGPNPLTSGLVGAALGTALGYGGGWLASRFLPEYVDRSLAKRLAPIGAAVGAGLPLWIHGRPNVSKHGLRGLLLSSPFQQRSSGNATATSQLYDRILKLFGSSQNLESGKKEAAYRPSYGRRGIAPWLAPGHDAGAFAPDVDTNAFGVAVLRDPFLDEKTKALIASLSLATGKATGSDWVTPMDVARVATAAGLGSAMGKALGMLAGPFLALTPKAQKSIQQAGLLAGAIKMIAGISR